MMQQDQYPVQLAVDYPDARNRLTVLFRWILGIPIVVVASLLGGSGSYGSSTLFLAPLVMIVFRRKYPRWWFDWNLALLKFETRIGTYLLLLRDEYPSTDEGQAVHLEIPYLDAQTGLNRWLPLVKWLLAIPHYVALVILLVGAVLVLIISWVAILLTGRHPRGLFNYTVGVTRWCTRVEAYAFVLATDRYPPFSLKP